MTPLALPVVLGAIAAVFPPEIEFAPNLAGALADAKKNGRLCVLVVTQEYAAGAAELAADCFADERIAALSKQTVNIKVDLESGDKAARDWIAAHLVKNDERRIRTPQVVFLRADGTVHSTCSGRLTPGEVEWAWVEALASAGVKVEAGERARPPESLREGVVETVEPKRAPPDKATIEKAEAALRADKQQYAVHASKLFHSRAPDIVKTYESSFAWYPDKAWQGTLAQMEHAVSREWAPVVKIAIRSPTDEVRKLAAKCAANVRNPDLVTMLLKVVKKEKDLAIRVEQLRALVACAPADRKVLAVLHKALRARQEEERLVAVELLQSLETLKEIEKGLTKALSDKSVAVRTAAADLVRTRRHPGLADVVEKALKKEKDAGAKEAMERALAAARKGFGKS